jgi:hypothetical protein
MLDSGPLLVQENLTILISMLQRYHHNCWTPQPTTLLHGDAPLALHVEPPTAVPIAAERDMFCLSGISEASAEDDFSPELMTG